MKATAECPRRFCGGFYYGDGRYLERDPSLWGGYPGTTDSPGYPLQLPSVWL